MTKSLPPTPSVKFLKLEAKNVLKAHRNGDTSCLEVLRHLHQFKDKPESEILDSRTSLQEVQFALALEYGFESWKALREHVDELSSSKNIDGIPFLTWQDREIPFFGSLEAATKSTKNPINYDEALVYSGYGLGFRWWTGGPETKAKWCVSSMDLGYSDSELVAIEAITEFFDWKLQPLWYELNMNDVEHQNIFNRVIESIDAGNPILCAPFGNISVIVGYRKNDMILQVHQYGNSEPAEMSLKNICGPPYLIFMEPQNAKNNKRGKSLNAGLTMALKHWNHSPVSYENGNYWYGASAWNKVKETLADFDSLSKEEKEQFLSTFEYTMQRVQGCRKATLRFLSTLGNDAENKSIDSIKTILRQEIESYSEFPLWQDVDPAIKLSATEKLVPSISKMDEDIMAIMKEGV